MFLGIISQCTMPPLSSAAAVIAAGANCETHVNLCLCLTVPARRLHRSFNKQKHSVKAFRFRLWPRRRLRIHNFVDMFAQRTMLPNVDKS
jgi:hypothetical protein